MLLHLLFSYQSNQLKTLFKNKRDTIPPNPVKDILNISTKKSIENVEAFNLAGQKVLNNTKVSNGQDWQPELKCSK